MTLREAREKRGLSIRELARLVPCNKSTIVDLEKKEREGGSGRPRTLILRERFDEILGTSFSEVQKNRSPAEEFTDPGSDEKNDESSRE